MKKEMEMEWKLVEYRNLRNQVTMMGIKGYIGFRFRELSYHNGYIYIYTR